MSHGEKKCENCGQWSSWNGKSSDTCEHCGELLSSKSYQYDHEKQSSEAARDYKGIFKITDEDSGLIRVFKKIGNFGYFIFMAILSFLAWVVAALPG
ncbi:hypothetical protein [Penaeicola halotolerans]|uniref:hypothetical protein n=1 Tax=Penaeicola halotolerans TaxID=2793196 RepID=UPI001CF8477A|nr:hypothetical protein [Penaeicola halotolerans]